MTEHKAKPLVLASASPRRRQLLKNLGLTFKVIPSNIEEPIDNSISPEEYVRHLAFNKAKDVADNLTYPAIVIGADTTVVVDNLSLGKPSNYNDAFKMLKLLSNKSHTVITGIAVIDTENQKHVIDSVSSEVYFKCLSDEEIANYIKTDEPMDKAGAYAIQGLAGTFITGINGCYSNIVGLPIFKLTHILKDFQFDILALNANKKK